MEEVVQEEMEPIILLAQHIQEKEEHRLQEELREYIRLIQLQMEALDKVEPQVDIHVLLIEVAEVEAGGWYGGRRSEPIDMPVVAEVQDLYGHQVLPQMYRAGYSVPTKYYLTDAATYGGNESFTSISGGTETGHSGDGYARITLVSGTVETTVEVQKKAMRWINIEKQIENGTLTGTFNYNGKKITEIDTNNNSIIHDGT